MRAGVVELTGLVEIQVAVQVQLVDAEVAGLAERPELLAGAVGDRGSTRLGSFIGLRDAIEPVDVIHHVERAVGADAGARAVDVVLGGGDELSS